MSHKVFLETHAKSAIGPTVERNEKQIINDLTPWKFEKYFKGNLFSVGKWLFQDFYG